MTASSKAVFATCLFLTFPTFRSTCMDVPFRSLAQ